MTDARIHVLTDTNTGKVIITRISQLGFNPEILSDPSQLRKLEGSDDSLNILIVDISDEAAAGLIPDINDSRLENFLKFIVLDSCEECGNFYSSAHFFNIELFTRPVDIRAFLLLFEKMIFSERYRQLFRMISSESESRIQTAGNLLQSSGTGSDLQEREKEREFFIKIIEFENRILEEHMKINDSIRHMALLRNTEYMVLEDRIRAEELLNELRRQELLDARNVIEAQESLLDYSSRELHETKRILTARENVEELSRIEAMELHSELRRLKDINKNLEKRIEVLYKDNENLRKRM